MGIGWQEHADFHPNIMVAPSTRLKMGDFPLDTSRTPYVLQGIGYSIIAQKHVAP